MTVGIVGGEYANGLRDDLPTHVWKERFGTGEPLCVKGSAVVMAALRPAGIVAALGAVFAFIMILWRGFDLGAVLGFTFLLLFMCVAVWGVGCLFGRRDLLVRNGYKRQFLIPDDWWYSLPVREMRKGGAFTSEVGGRLWFCTAAGAENDTILKFGDAVPWESLAAFEIAQHSRYFRNQFGWPKLSDWLVIVGHVDDGTVLPFANCAARTQAEMAQLHARLTREFIGRRGPILQHEEALRLDVLSAVRQATRPNGM